MLIIMHQCKAMAGQIEDSIDFAATFLINMVFFGLDRSIDIWTRSNHRYYTGYIHAHNMFADYIQNECKASRDEAEGWGSVRVALAFDGRSCSSHSGCSSKLTTYTSAFPGQSVQEHMPRQ